jgi:hypothetical protein
MANAPLSGRDAINTQVIWVGSEAKYFCKWGWTQHRVICPFGQIHRWSRHPEQQLSRHPRDERNAFAREVRALSCAPRRMAASTKLNSILRGAPKMARTSEPVNLFDVCVFWPCNPLI